MRYRHCSVAHGEELIQTTRLESGWHEEHVAAGDYFVRSGVGETYPAPAAAGTLGD